MSQQLQIVCPVTYCHGKFKTTAWGEQPCPHCGQTLNVTQQPVARPAREPLPFNHRAHIALCLLTCGIWVPFYGLALLIDERRNQLQRP